MRNIISKIMDKKRIEKYKKMGAVLWEDHLKENYTEEEIVGTAIFSTKTGSETLDLATASNFYFSLSGDYTITAVSNAPSVGKSFVRTFTIKSSSTQTLSLPVGWVIIGSYEATGVENYLTVNFSNTATTGAKVVCYITQA